MQLVRDAGLRQRIAISVCRDGKAIGDGDPFGRESRIQLAKRRGLAADKPDVVQSNFEERPDIFFHIDIRARSIFPVLRKIKIPHGQWGGALGTIRLIVSAAGGRRSASSISVAARSPLRRRRRSPHDQTGLEHDALAARRGVGDLVEQQARGLVAHVSLRDAHGGQRRRQHVDIGHVVVADHRHVGRAVQTALAERIVGSERKQVVGGDDRRRR